MPLIVVLWTFVFIWNCEEILDQITSWPGISRLLKKPIFVLNFQLTSLPCNFQFCRCNHYKLEWNMKQVKRYFVTFLSKSTLSKSCANYFKFRCTLPYLTRVYSSPPNHISKLLIHVMQSNRHPYWNFPSTLFQWNQMPNKNTCKGYLRKFGQVQDCISLCNATGSNISVC